MTPAKLLCAVLVFCISLPAYATWYQRDTFQLRSSFDHLQTTSKPAAREAMLSSEVVALLSVKRLSIQDGYQLWPYTRNIEEPVLVQEGNQILQRLRQDVTAFSMDRVFIDRKLNRISNLYANVVAELGTYHPLYPSVQAQRAKVLEAYANSGDSSSRLVEVNAMLNDLEASLRYARAGVGLKAQITQATLAINTHPYSWITVDGKATQMRTPLWPNQPLQLTAGKHLITFETEDAHYDYEVIVEPGRENKLIIRHLGYSTTGNVWARFVGKR